MVDVRDPARFSEPRRNASAVDLTMPARFSDEHRLPAWKITAFQYAVCFAFVVLLAGYWRLQVHQHHKYLGQADRNRIRNLPVIAPRGKILDREGRVLVDNFPAFSILLSRENAFDAHS